MSDNISLSDEKAAEFLQSTVDDLRTGEKPREELRDEMLAVLFLEDPVIARDGPLKSQGRLAFGNKHASREGVGIYVPADALPSESEEEN